MRLSTGLGAPNALAAQWGGAAPTDADIDDLVAFLGTPTDADLAH